VNRVYHLAGMDERTGLQCEGGNARCFARSHSGRRWPHKKQPAEAAIALVLRADSPPTRSMRSIGSGGEGYSTPRSLAGNVVHAFSKGNNFLPHCVA
jgi:hypothetical protein